MSRRLATNLIIALTVFLSASLLSGYPPLRSLRYVLHDWFFVLRGEIPVSEDLILIEIDDATLSAYGVEKIPRGQYGLLIEGLDAAGARAIGFDVLFADHSADPASDSALSGATHYSSTVVHSVDFEFWESNGPSVDTASLFKTRCAPYADLIEDLNPYAANPEHCTLPFPELWSSVRSIGTMSVRPSSDEVNRELPLLVRWDDDVVPALALETLRLAAGGGAAEVSHSDGELRITGALGSFVVPVDERAQTVVNFSGSGARFRRYSLVDVVRTQNEPHGRPTEDLRQVFADKIVLIGGTSSDPDFEDLRRTPFQEEAGLYIHANMISSVLTDQTLARVARPVELSIQFMLALGLGILVSRRSLMLRVGLLLAVPVVYFVVAYQLFAKAGTIIPMAVPLAAWTAGAIAIVGLNSLRRLDLRGRLTVAAEREYDTFDLQVEASVTGYRARVLDSPAGEPTGVFDSPISKDELERLKWDLNPRHAVRDDTPTGGASSTQSETENIIKRTGARLFEAAFSGEIRAVLQSCLDEARRSGRGLRLRLRLADVPELQALPWEVLYNPARNQFLALSTHTPLVRYIPQATITQPLGIDLPLQILVVTSSPASFEFDAESEWRTIESGLQTLTDAGLVSVQRLSAATVGALQEAVRRQTFHILHYIGHGIFDELTGTGSLVLEDESRKPLITTGDRLAHLLRDAGGLRLVVLNACEGAVSSSTNVFSGVAQSLVRVGVPAVIGMQLEVHHEDADVLTRELYRYISENTPIDTAVAEIRRTLYQGGTGTAWIAPVLYMRSRDGRILRVRN